MNGLAIKNLAHAIAVVAHDGQSRKGLGEPYINHVERVADSVYGWKNKSIAYLHDVIEDSPIEQTDLFNIGIPEDICYGVFILSRDKNDSYEEFIRKIITYSDILNLELIKIKIADIKDNMRDIDDTDMPGLRRRYSKALVALEEALEGE